MQNKFLQKKDLTKKSMYKRRLGVLLTIIQFVFTLIFLLLLLKLDILPVKFLIPLSIILLVISITTFFTQVIEKCFWIGKIFAIVICILLFIGSFYMFKIQRMISIISDANTKIDDVEVVVLKEDSAETIEDAADYIFGIQEKIDRDNSDKIIQELEDNLETEIKTETYPEFDSQVEALYLGRVNALIINKAHREMITDIFKDFDKDTRVLSEKKIETQVKLKESEKKVNKDPFMVYISGIDTYGSISTTSRSDVNIIATVNPNTKQILLTTTPRDYYVVFPISDGIRDKLTHAGIYGVDVSVGALEKLYDITINYYVRINFTSLIQIIDALGDVTVDSKYAFCAGNYSFCEGKNQLDGEAALAFTRERYAFASGDNQRGENQMLVMKAMINKASSPAMIKNIGSILKSISNSMETNMSQTEITNLIKMQMNDGDNWDVILTSVKGTDDRRTTYSYRSRELYVMIPDEETVEAAKEKIQQVMENVVIK